MATSGAKKPQVTSPMFFNENEKVLCFHGPLMYEAKVIKAEKWTDTANVHASTGPHYFVHYRGWKQSWDEWVPEERVLKFNEENLKKQKTLVEAQKARDLQALELEKAKAAQAAAAAGPSAAGAPAATAVKARDGRGTKRGREGENEDEYMKRPEIKIVLPDVLKSLLVDDWEAITRNQQLVPMPRKPNVSDMLEAYKEHATKQNMSRGGAGLISETIAGLKLYFNKSVGNNLLYRFERGRYVEYVTKNKPADGSEIDMCTVFGAEHFLRLFVNLPELIAHTVMDAETVTVLREQLQALLKWLAANKGKYFLKDYDNTPTAYRNQNTN